MTQESSHASLEGMLALVRRGDPDAAADFVERFAPEIRTEVRQYLREGRIRRLVDSEDVCQSVLASLLLRLGADEYEIDDPQQLSRLLLRIARNKVNGQLRRHYAARRDVRRTEPLSTNGHTAVAGETPSARLVHDELVDELRSRLGPTERRVAQLRKEGQTWDQIAEVVGNTAEGIRKQFERALHEATLGLFSEE